MLNFKIRKAAKIFDRDHGGGQVWVSGPKDLRYLHDGVPNSSELENRQILWRVRWDDKWEWIETHWSEDESELYTDELLKMESESSVMFFVPDVV